MTTHDAMAQIYRGAAALIHECGWTQGRPKSIDGCYCMVGAIWEVNWRLALRPLWTQCVHELQAHLAPCVTDWNDAPGRTVEEVQEALALAAEYHEAQTGEIE